MIRYTTCFVVVYLAATVGALSQENRKPPPVECEPQPDCRVIVSPLRPGAPGIGIRDKGLIDRSTGIQQQPLGTDYRRSNSGSEPRPNR